MVTAAMRRHWHLLALSAWSGIWFAILAPRGGIAWKFFTWGSAVMFGDPGNFHHAGGLHLYANYPELQIGPLAFAIAEALRRLTPGDGLVAAQILLSFMGVVIIWAVDQIARAARSGLARDRPLWLATVLGGGALFVIGWAELAVAFAHLDDGLALLLAVLAVRAALARRPVLTGLCLGLAADAKPWALVVLPVLLLLPRRHWWRAALATAAAALAGWLPFLLGDPRTLAAARFAIANMPDSALRALGVNAATTPPWDRPAQIALGCLLGAAAVRRGRWPAVILLGIGARIALDPGVHSYYTAGIMAGALLWDVVSARRPFPFWSAVSFAALNLAPLLTKDAPLLGQLRLGLVVAFTVTILLTPDRRRHQPGEGGRSGQRGLPAPPDANRLEPV